MTYCVYVVLLSVHENITKTYSKNHKKHFVTWNIINVNKIYKTNPYLFIETICKGNISHFYLVSLNAQKNLN